MQVALLFPCSADRRKVHRTVAAKPHPPTLRLPRQYKSTVTAVPVANHYATLGVSEDAPSSVIAAAYKALLREHHPDRAVDEADRVRRERRCGQLGEAHTVLSDTVLRARHDDELRNDRLREADVQRQRDRSSPAGAQNRAEPESETRFDPFLDPGTPLLEPEEHLGGRAPGPLYRASYVVVDEHGRVRDLRGPLQWRWRKIPKVGGYPLAWLGLPATPDRPSARPRRGHLLLAMFAGAGLAAVSGWVFNTSPVPADRLAEVLPSATSLLTAHPYHFATLLRWAGVGGAVTFVVWATWGRALYRWRRGPLSGALTLGVLFVAAAFTRYLLAFAFVATVAAIALALLWWLYEELTGEHN